MEEYNKIFYNQFAVKLDKKAPSVSGKFDVVEQDGKEIFVIGASKDKMEFLVHECMHAVSYMLRERGIILDESSEEIYCYALQFLIGQILSNKVDKRIVVRK